MLAIGRAPIPIEGRHDRLCGRARLVGMEDFVERDD